MPNAKDLNTLPHKISVIHKLSGYGKEMWFQSAAWAEGKDKFIFQTWFLDEAYFHVDGTVMKQNMRYWETEPPVNSQIRSSHRGNVTVWVAKSKQGLMGPMFFNELWTIFAYALEWLLAATYSKWLASAGTCGLCKMVPHCMMQTLCWTSWTLYLAPASCQTATRTITTAATFGHLSVPI